MTNPPVGSRIRLKQPYLFEDSTAARYFPNGLSPMHWLIFCSYHRNDWHTGADVYVMVPGRHPAHDHPFLYWGNPIIALPPELFEEEFEL